MARKKKQQFVEDPTKPCRTCLVRPDRDCTRIKCERWRKWWVARWDYTCELCKPYFEKEGS